jgi:hypothetical protein
MFGYWLLPQYDRVKEQIRLHEAFDTHLASGHWMIMFVRLVLQR